MRENQARIGWIPKDYEPCDDLMGDLEMNAAVNHCLDFLKQNKYRGPGEETQVKTFLDVDHFVL